MDALNLDDEDDLSFYSLPGGGGALITTADGDIVGEINLSGSGDVNIKATAIDAEGNSVAINNHIDVQGDVQTQDQYNAAVQQQASALANSLVAVSNWDHLNDLGKLSAFVSLYNATDNWARLFLARATT